MERQYKIVSTLLYFQMFWCNSGLYAGPRKADRADLELVLRHSYLGTVHCIFAGHCISFQGTERGAYLVGICYQLRFRYLEQFRRLGTEHPTLSPPC